MTAIESAVKFAARPPMVAAQTIGDASPAAAEVLRQLSLTLTAFGCFKELAQARLDPWEESSLCVAEQALERAWLAFSQLHADLQGPPRRA
jgi:hypothetical protein